MRLDLSLVSEHFPYMSVEKKPTLAALCEPRRQQLPVATREGGNYRSSSWELRKLPS